MEGPEKAIEIKFGGARALLRQRANGFWIIRWREAGTPRSTTRVRKADAEDFARRKVRELAAGQGGRMMTVDDAHLVQRLRALVGDRSPFGLLEQLETAARRLGGIEAFPRALQHYEASGLASVLRVSMRVALRRFFDGYDKQRPETVRALHKELDAFEAQPGCGDMMVCELTEDWLGDWVNRRKADGEPVEPRTFNNRVASWKTFLNRCRDWNYWPKGERHPAERVKLETEPDRVPSILTVAQAQALLSAVRDQRPRLLNYLVIGCWLGLRPGEIDRLQVDAWDWERGYVNVSPEVATKTMQQRFVPIPDNVRAILGGVMADPRRKVRLGGRQRAMCCGSSHAENLSLFARAQGILEAWDPDVMRHSYISHRLAQGHGRGQVAEWAGNSEAVIRKRYRRPLMREEGEAWFRIGLGSGLG